MKLLDLLLPVMNVVFFYAGWLICLSAAEAGKGWVGVVFTFAVFALHCSLSKTAKKDALLTLIIVILGTVLDSFYQDIGWIVYKSPSILFPFLAPLWVSSLYVLLAMNMDHGLRWLSKRTYVAAILGSWGAVATYLAGETMGAAEVLNPYAVYYIGAIWLLFFPFLFWISRQLNRFFFTDSPAKE